MIVNGGVDISKKPIWAEGPHIFKRDGRYYLITAEGGTGNDHSEVVYRGESPEGPWTAYPKPILTQRDLDPQRRYPVTSAGHAAIVETQNGEWWATFLATRPYGDDLYNTGRETFLLPVHWRDGWPIITAPGQQIAPVVRYPDLPREQPPATPTSGNFVLREEFDGKALAPYWMTPRIPKSAWHRLRGGTLELTPRAVRIGETLQPSFIARRQQHLVMTASTSLRFTAANPGDKAGLAVYQDDAHYYFIGIVNDGGRRLLRVERRVGASDPVDGAVLASVPLDAADVQLHVRARGGRYDFSYRTGSMAVDTTATGCRRHHSQHQGGGRLCGRHDWTVRAFRIRTDLALLKGGRHVCRLDPRHLAPSCGCDTDRADRRRACAVETWHDSRGICAS